MLEMPTIIVKLVVSGIMTYYFADEVISVMA